MENSVPLGDSAFLTCVAGGYPLPNITWSRDGMAIMSGDDFNITESQLQGEDVTRIMSILELCDAQLSHSGRYVCRAENSLETFTDNAEISFNLNVLSEFISSICPCLCYCLSLHVTVFRCTSADRPPQSCSIRPPCWGHDHQRVCCHRQPQTRPQLGEGRIPSVWRYPEHNTRWLQCFQSADDWSIPARERWCLPVPGQWIHPRRQQHGGQLKHQPNHIHM